MSGDMMCGERISIENEFFKNARNEFDRKLQEVFFQMENKDIDAAEITLKLSIVLFDKSVCDEDGHDRVARVPVMQFKVSRSMKLSDTSEGFCEAKNQVEILRGNDGFMLREFVAQDKQCSMFDDDDDYENHRY